MTVSEFETQVPPTAEAYLGMHWVPEHERQPLLERMGDYELELMLGNANDELKVATLAVLLDGPLTPRAAYDMLAEQDAFEIEPMTFSNFPKRLGGFAPGILAKESDGRVGLTGFGLTVASFGGQVVALGLRHNIPVSDILGTKVARFPAIEDGDRAYGQARRLLLLSLIAGSGSVSAGSFINEINPRYGIQKGTFRSATDSLAEAGLITKERQAGQRKERAFQLNPERGELVREYLQVIGAFAERDADAVDAGLKLARDMIASKGTLPFLIRRAFGQADEKRYPTLYAVQQEVVELLELEQRPLSVSEIHELLGERYTGSIAALSVALRDIADRLQHPQITPAGERVKGKTILWDLSKQPSRKNH